jgi:hypothetical protein
MSDCLKLRNEYISCIKLANETDSKKEDALLRSEAKALLEKLVSVCDHAETVCLCSEYEGSYSMDYDDRNSEDRKCLCCGIYESAYGGEFKTLITTPIARFELGVFNSKLPNQLKHPLSYLLSEAKEYAINNGYRFHGRVRLK